MNPKSIEKTSIGTYCKSGDFYVDPYGSAKISLITHAHGDHARIGSDVYYCASLCEPLLKQRLGSETVIKSFAYGEKFKLGNAWLSFHPAGHILGSAQIRIEVGEHVTVISGDYKRNPDPTCEAFEVVPCHEFVTESTFGLPIYNWDEANTTTQDILNWWKYNAEREQASVLFCYSLGKAQRILGMLNKLTSQPILVHGAIAVLNKVYESLGVSLAPWNLVQEIKDKELYKKSLILAPPSALGSPWLKKFHPCKTALASGWMSVRGTRRRRGVDAGFVLSDHADWKGLLRTAHESCAEKIWVTHGSEDTFAQYLTEFENLTAFPYHLHEPHLDEDEGN